MGVTGDAARVGLKSHAIKTVKWEVPSLSALRGWTDEDEDPACSFRVGAILRWSGSHTGGTSFTSPALLPAILRYGFSKPKQQNSPGR